jgi:hypothetical protein
MALAALLLANGPAASATLVTHDFGGSGGVQLNLQNQNINDDVTGNETDTISFLFF